MDSMGSIINLKDKTIEFQLENGNNETIGFSQYMSNVLKPHHSSSSHIIFQEEELLRSPIGSPGSVHSNALLFDYIDDVLEDLSSINPGFDSPSVTCLRANIANSLSFIAGLLTDFT